MHLPAHSVALMLHQKGPGCAARIDALLALSSLLNHHSASATPLSPILHLVHGAHYHYLHPKEVNKSQQTAQRLQEASDNSTHQQTETCTAQHHCLLSTIVCAGWVSDSRVKIDPILPLLEH